MEFITNSPQQTIELAKKVGESLKGGEIIAFVGGLGVGKTTFTRGIAMGFGVGDVVTSPTFALVNEYVSGRRRLAHFDMYRITASELETTGFYDYLDGETVIVIEWSENIADELSGELGNLIEIELTRLSDEQRSVKITGIDVEVTADEMGEIM